MTEKEFYLEHDGFRLHMKLAKPKAPSRCNLAIIQHGFTGDMEEDHNVGVSRALNDAGIATLRTELYGHGQSDGKFKDHTIYKWMTQMMFIINYAAGLDFVDKLFLPYLPSGR